MTKKKSKAKSKEIFRRTMKVSQVVDKRILRAEGDDSYSEKATLTDGSGDKITITLPGLPTGLSKGAEVEILIATAQTTIEEHS